MLIQPHRIKFEIFDKFGNLEFRKEQLMKSFVSNWVKYIRSEVIAVNAPLTDTAGGARNVAYTYPLVVNAAEAVATFGIRVGTSDQVIATADYNIIAGIAHGNSASQLYHKVTTVSAVTVGAASAYFTIQRNFDNNSGGGITIKEVALIGDDQNSIYFFLLARDLTGDIVVATAKTFVATYTFTASV